MRIRIYDIERPALMIMLMCFLGISCEKKDNPAEEKPPTVNWEIVKNFPQAQSYNIAKLIVHGGFGFVPTSGHGSMANPTTMNNQFRGSLFFEKADGWYVNQQVDEGVTDLKIFNGQLYGLREKRGIRTTYPVIQYQHAYVVFKWENGGYTDLATLEYRNNHLIEKASLGETMLWVNQNKLHLAAVTSTSVLKLWELAGNRLVEKSGAEMRVGSSSLIMATEGKELAITDEGQRTPSHNRTTFDVTGYYYKSDGSFVKGKTHSFYTDYDNNGSIISTNKDAVAYRAFNGSLWGIGYQKNAIRNYDSGEVIGGVSAGKVLRSDRIVMNNGKVYIMLGKEDEVAACAGLAVFDGTRITEMPFVLPDILDACSRLVDACEYDGKTYLLLENRGQYVVVKSMH